MIKIKLGHKEQAPPVVEKWMSQFAKDLEKRWTDQSELIFSTWQDVTQEVTKALDNPYPIVSTAISMLTDAMMPNPLLIQQLIEKYIGSSFAYGIALANAGEAGIANPPSEKTAADLTQQPGFVDIIAMQFAQATAFNEVTSKDSEIMGLFRRKLIAALANREDPYTSAREIAGELDQYQAGWSTISRTEMARSLGQGSLDQTRRLGREHVYLPPTNTSCIHCIRLLEKRVFPIDALEGASNFGKKQRDWTAAIPLHPNCTHHPIPASSWVVEQALKTADPIPSEGVVVQYIPPAER